MSERSLRRDERAIEGLPIRLVIAVVVGVASLGVMMNVIAGLETLGVTELDTRPEPEIVEPGHTEIEVTVVDPDGRPVSNATVIASGDTARMSSIVTAQTGHDGIATLAIDPELGPNQQRGTVALDVRPPGDEYTDRRENAGVLVVRG